MRGISSIYGWQGGKNPPSPTPECSRARHAKLIEESGRMMYDARRAAYDWYSKECRAWGREPAPEDKWFMYANGACVRMLRGEVKT